MSNNLETQTIYEIFRACRLCGAGGGYKMPIIPSVVGLDCTDIELRQKIRECVQIEVNQEDKMPPLICELCVDKVNDFYEFLEMCRETNRQTRVRLGLPPQTLQPNIEAPDCILGVTEQIYDQDDEPLSCATKVKIKKEKDTDKKKDGDKKKDNDRRKEKERNKENSRVKSLRKELENLVMNDLSPDSRSSKRASIESPPRAPPGPASRRARRPSPPAEDLPPIRISLKTQKKRDKEEPSSKQDKPGPRRFKMADRSSESPKPKPISKIETETKPIVIDSDDDIPLTPRLKRPLTKAERKQEQTMDTMQPPPKKHKPSRNPSSEDSIPSSDLHRCSQCSGLFRTKAALSSHRRALHPYTSEPATEKTGKTKKNTDSNKQEQRKETDNKRELRKETETSKRELRKETETSKRELRKETETSKRELRKETETSKRELRKETETSKRELQKETEINKREMKKETETGKPSKQEQREGSSESFKAFVCKVCDKSYQTKFGLKRHIDKCHQTKSGVSIASNIKIPPSVLSRLLPAQVRTARCDPLLTRTRTCHIRAGTQDFGFDLRCVYPYRSLVRVKQEPLASDFMVSIDQDVKNEFYREEDYVHWDSDLSSDTDDEFSLVTPGKKNKTVPSLTKLSLKTLFSKRCLGKVPRKLRKVKNDEKFDSLFNTDFDDMQSDINNIIDNLTDTINDGCENNGDGKMMNSENNAADIEETDDKVSVSETNEENVKEMDGIVSTGENNVATIEGDDASASNVDNKVSSIEESYVNGANENKNNDNDSINSFNTNGEVNYESDSLLGKENRVEKADHDASKNENLDSALSNAITDENVSNTLSMQRSETDDLVDIGEAKCKSQSTTDVESSQEEETTQNGVTENGVGQNELIDELDNLIGEKDIIDEIDEQIYGVDSKIAGIEKNDSDSEKKRENEITLDDLGEKTDRSMDLDSISDGDFNFDA